MDSKMEHPQIGLSTLPPDIMHVSFGTMTFQMPSLNGMDYDITDYIDTYYDSYIDNMIIVI